MGASSVVRVKSPNNEQQRDEQNNHHRPQMIVPRLNVQDIENNNNHIFVNPHDRFLTLIDECDLLNNNTTLLSNNNYLSVTLSPSSETATTITNKANALKTSTSLFKLNKKSSLNRKMAPLEESAALVKSNNEKKTQRESSKSPKKQQIAKENENKKKKKEKPKAPRAPNAGGGGGGGGRRGMADQDRMTRRPKKSKLDTKAEK
jgi:glutamyl/glutaminyl-tRNA synthetase